ncbi:hypothetical protein, partial [Desulfatiferula olefinivorans]
FPLEKSYRFINHPFAALTEEHAYEKVSQEKTPLYNKKSIFLAYGLHAPSTLHIIFNATAFSLTVLTLSNICNKDISIPHTPI